MPSSLARFSPAQALLMQEQVVHFISGLMTQKVPFIVARSDMSRRSFSAKAA
ncbi:MAG: hypothetical protein WAV78_36610 [Xanthobacteraceae bacterium]